MRPEIRVKLGDILKKERDAEKVCALLKEDAKLEVTDAELAEVRDVIGIMPPPPDPSEHELQMKKAADDLRAAQDKAEEAEKELTKIREDNHRAEIKKWVEENCEYLNNMTTDEATDQIIKAEAVDKMTAETLKTSFKSTSDALKASALVKEIGREGGNEGVNDPIGGNFIGEVDRIKNELRKSGDRKESDLILQAIKMAGPVKYEAYRKEFNRRARTY